MSELANCPARVNRATAMRLLSVTGYVFKKVVDANPQLKHKLPGETRCRYLRDEIAKLLRAVPAAPTVCDPRGRKSKP